MYDILWIFMFYYLLGSKGLIAAGKLTEKFGY